jgi:hypothetical protein
MWTTKNRKRYDRSQLRYPSDLTGAGCTVDPAGRVRRQQTHGQRLGGDERDHVHSQQHSMPVAGDPERPAAALAGASPLELYCSIAT